MRKTPSLFLLALMTSVVLASFSTPRGIAAPRAAQAPTAYTWEFVDNETELIYQQTLGDGVHEITFAIDVLNATTGEVIAHDTDSGIAKSTRKVLSKEVNAQNNATATLAQYPVNEVLVSCYNVTYADGVKFTYAAESGIAVRVAYTYGTIELKDFPWNIVEEEDIPGVPVGALVLATVLGIGVLAWRKRRSPGRP